MAITIVDCTMTGDIEFGSTCRKMIGALLHPERRGGEHVVGVPLAEHLAAQQPGEHRDLHDRHGDDHRPLVGPLEQRRDGDGQQQRREREHHVDDAHHDGVHPAAERTGEQAEEHAADQAEQGGHDTDQQGLPGRQHHPGEQVAAQEVAPPREAGLRRRERFLAALTWPRSSWAAGSWVASSGANRASRRNRATITAPVQNTGDTRIRRQASISSETPPLGVGELIDALLAQPSPGEGHASAPAVRSRGSTMA